MTLSKPISINLSPNTQSDDLILTLKNIFQPWKWKNGTEILELEELFKKNLNRKYIFFFNSGRSALMAILKALELGKESEILVQAFTCNALVNPIIWMGLKPIFVDCLEDTLNMDPEDLKKKIGKKSKAVIVQHTFGLAAQMDEILKICQEHNLILIEDCAHSLGAKYRGKLCGTFGLASFFSFGRDKTISSVYGGMVSTNDYFLAEKIKKFQEKIPFPSFLWIFQQLLHPLLIDLLVKPFYSFFYIGKYLLFIFQKLKIISPAVTLEEKRGKLPNYFPQKFPNALASLALNQFKKLENFNAHRQKISKIYNQFFKKFKEIKMPLENNERIYLKYSLIVENKNTDDILKKLKKKGIFLNDGWRNNVIVPPDTDEKKMGYCLGFCPVAEKLSKKIINLPTHINISEKEVKKILIILEEILNDEIRKNKR